MRTGPMDRYVAIEMPTTTRGPTGQPIETWATFVRLWMGKRDIRATERVAGGQQDLASETTIWRGHWVDGVTPEMRINDDDRLYDIEAVVEIGRREGMELTGTLVRVG